MAPKAAGYPARSADTYVTEMRQGEQGLKHTGIDSVSCDFLWNLEGDMAYARTHLLRSC